MGMGHLVRSLALAEALSEDYQVIFLSGGVIPEQWRMPSYIHLMQLPALQQTPDGCIRSVASTNGIPAVRRARRALIRELLFVHRPQVLFIELFPFGRKKFAGELLPLLEEANRLGKDAPLTVCSLRDILMSNRRDQTRHENRAALVANRYFDAVLVHADPQFSGLEESFQPSIPLECPVYYTGYVTPAAAASTAAKTATPGPLLVTAGGGRYGEALFNCALQVQPFLRQKHGIPMKVITGPFIETAAFARLKEQEKSHPGLMVEKFAPSIVEEMRKARASLSQCGYNTSMDILRSKTPALVVPFADGREDEQQRRAALLAERGLVEVLDPGKLSPENLSGALEKLLSFRPAKISLNLNGAANTVDMLRKLRARAQRSAARARNKPVFPAWLDPLRKVLDQAMEPVAFFFRDDDAGWEDARLLALMDLFHNYALPLDLAVIPGALNSRLAGLLAGRKESTPDLIGLHQHGYLHQNHELLGRKCEFGGSRCFEKQFRDLWRGKRMLEDYLGDNSDPIFTPPWNRCLSITGHCLNLLGFQGLSRDSSAQPLNIPGLPELPVQVDWFKKVAQERLELPRRGLMLAEKARQQKPVGIMFHHTWMDRSERADLEPLLYLLASHSNALCRSMRRQMETQTAGATGGTAEARVIVQAPASPPAPAREGDWEEITGLGAAANKKDKP